MIRVQSTFLQPRKYDGLLLTGWKIGTTEVNVIVRVREMARDKTRVKLWLEVRARVRPRYKRQVGDGPP